MAAANVPDLKPASDQVFEHFYFAIQAALEGLGVVMGPLALIREELRAGQLLYGSPEISGQECVFCLGPRFDSGHHSGTTIERTKPEPRRPRRASGPSRCWWRTGSTPSRRRP